jgi:hypothetical protein
MYKTEEIGKDCSIKKVRVERKKKRQKSEQTGQIKYSNRPEGIMVSW